MRQREASRRNLGSRANSPLVRAIRQWWREAQQERLESRGQADLTADRYPAWQL
jgi:uncharacterized membrane protein YfbV (UPF0208 family)